MGLRRLFNLKVMGKDALHKLAEEAATRAVVEEREFKEIEREQEVKAIGEEGYASRLQEALSTKAGELTVKEDKYWLLLGQEEDLQRVISTEDLHNVQDACFNKYIIDPHMRSIANNVKQYTIGRGIKYETPDPKAQMKLNEFWKGNLMERRQKRMVLSEFLEGEYFLLYFADYTTGRVRVRKIPPKQISDIETHPEDLETKLAYERTYTVRGEPKTVWYADVDYLLQKGANGATSMHEGQFNADRFVQFIKEGFEDETRGRPPCYSVLKWLKLYEDLLIDGARRWHELAKVIWKKKITSPRGGISTRSERAPKGGVMLVETENKTYSTEAPKVAAGEAETIGKMLLHRIGAGQTIPLHILDQDASNENYASIRKSDSPYNQMIMDRQDFWQIEFERMLRVPLRVAVKADKLQKETKILSYAVEVLVEVLDRINHRVFEGVGRKEIVEEATAILEERGDEKEVVIRTVDLPISIIFPDVIHENPKELAEVLKIHKELGIAAKATLAERAGYDWQHQLLRMADEREREKKQAEEALIGFGHGKDTGAEIDFEGLDLEGED